MSRHKRGKLVSFYDLIHYPLPHLPTWHCPRADWQTEEQYAAQMATDRHYHRLHTCALAMFHALATAYGYHKTCKKSACRRMGRCTGMRIDPEEEDDGYPVYLFPLCGTIEMAERVRDGIREIARIQRETKRKVMVAPDGSLHPGEEMVEDET